jgi:hypothetical protein
MCSARNNRLSEAKAPLICFRIDDSCSLRLERQSEHSRLFRATESPTRAL